MFFRHRYPGCRSAVAGRASVVLASLVLALGTNNLARLAHQTGGHSRHHAPPHGLLTCGPVTVCGHASEFNARSVWESAYGGNERPSSAARVDGPSHDHAHHCPLCEQATQLAASVIAETVSVVAMVPPRTPSEYRSPFHRVSIRALPHSPRAPPIDA
ncbi:MAG: hypothetical protein FJ297_07220 [Planctomycetes bacterium]|nr:hypothetical protein [Planctomycetota bacterium]